MKNYLNYALIVILNLLGWYSISSFILLEINFTKWDSSLRFLLIYLSAITSLFLIARIYNINKENEV